MARVVGGSGHQWFDGADNTSVCDDRFRQGGAWVRFGAVFPHHDVGNDRMAIRDFARGVESLGFDHLVAYDHVLGAPHDGRGRPLVGPYDDSHEFHEPFVLFGHLGAVTERVELVVGVLVAPQRQTALVAKQAAEVQALSGGRLRLALGSGWNWVEYETLGADFERRGAVLDEQAVLLQRLWSEPLVTFHGEFHHVDRAGIQPLPDTPIPLWFGGYAGRALERSSRFGAGHLFGHLRDATHASARRLRALRPFDFGLEAVTDVIVESEQWVDDVHRWAASGGTHLSIRSLRTAGLPDPGHRTVDEHLAAMERWRDTLAAAGLWSRSEGGRGSEA